MDVYRRFITLSTGQIHYRESGTADNCLLLINEMPLSSEVFLPLLKIIGEEVHAIAPDLPGYGDSPPVSGIKTIQGYASCLLELMGNLHITHISILGVHGGASIAVEMAKRAPDKVNKLILSGVPIFNEEERKTLHENLKSFHLEEDGSHFQLWWNFYKDKWGRGTPKETLQLAVMNVMKAGADYEWGYRAAFDYDPIQALRMLNQPIYLLIAEKDVLRSKNVIVRKLFSSALEKVVRVPHHLSLNAPRETADLILKFIKNG